MTTMHDEPDSSNTLIEERRQKLSRLRQLGNAYPNDFRRDHLALALHTAYGDKDQKALDQLAAKAKVAGRVMRRRGMGKASFVHLQDTSGQIQLYIRQDRVGESAYQDFKQWDLGDIVAASGSVFKTKTGELTILVETLRLMTKSLRPLPEKYHGLADVETVYRQRYLDLLSNTKSRHRFEMRAKIIECTRSFLKERGFLEVETPMMHAIPGGASARPFISHHNTLDMDLYLRIAPELHLKRLIIGGMESVFEINRSFRNEGLSPSHNPEFTMLEFYQAFSDYRDLMQLTEELLHGLAQQIHGCGSIPYQGKTYNLAPPYPRVTLRQAIYDQHHGVSEEMLIDLSKVRMLADRLDVPYQEADTASKIELEIFEKTVEPNLQDPVFITHYPVEASPLARRLDSDPGLTERFEFFVAGREIANGFSELNDPDDQAKRFREQMALAGDDEHSEYDEDYITALEYGMPPTAGEGIGIDRLTMLLTDVASIRDVILFPLLRPR